jgi:hypothetical protein
MTQPFSNRRQSIFRGLVDINLEGRAKYSVCGLLENEIHFYQMAWPKVADP